MDQQLSLPLYVQESAHEPLHKELAEFAAFGTPTQRDVFKVPGCPEVPIYLNEFWTAKQRAAHSLHEVSYRACFKPQLPRFFIERLTKPGDVVYDPFLGRGTTLLEAGLMGRVPWGCDINPLSRILVLPRLDPPTQAQVAKHLDQMDLESATEAGPEELLTFYHPNVLKSLQGMKERFLVSENKLDAWVRMVATNRLTGHSPGFFSVYSLPPNQAVSVQSQKRINEQRDQVPPDRDLGAILLKKSKQLLKDLTAEEASALHSISSKARIITGSCDATPDLPSNSVSLVVTSPPFLNEVDYKTDNWLRCWFNGISLEGVKLWMIRKPAAWQEKMTDVFHELHRILKPGGHVAFEVGEVVKGKIKLEELVIPAAMKAGFDPALILINSQVFTKTSNCWGVSNQELGTNTNRIVLLRKRS